MSRLKDQTKEHVSKLHENSSTHEHNLKNYVKPEQLNFMILLAHLLENRVYAEKYVFNLTF